ncbi:hypothetical protein CPB84DRAFT_1686015 [Gymnopilus junonius]|uniref:Tail specific protease domain-containing protein n=1 Tax=Gymnopilus junonius TaxID=109634 RepID=A0A9P5NDQ9_GYMJU|nr:hypothetical protein CPB84DRAFT_1686015 [Gymnopilus junonius]
MTPRRTLLSLLLAPLLSVAAPSSPAAASDPCAKIGGLEFVPPAEALACYKAFPFNETLRQNVLTNMARVFDFYTFEDFYLNSPPPFQESTKNIRATLAQLNTTRFATDYDFNKAVYDFTTQLNDGHTRYFPSCYNAFQNLLPAPVVSLEENGVQNVFIVPDAVEFVSQLGPNYTGFFDKIGFNWQRLAGAKVLEIEGMDAYSYVDLIADTVSGNYLDHGVRVNSVFSSYRISGGAFSQRFGDLAGPEDVTHTSLKFKLIPANSTRVETVGIPYLADFIGVPFTDSSSFWENNCVANDATNGIDIRSAGVNAAKRTRKQPKASIIDGLNSRAINLPGPFIPTQPVVNGSDDAIQSFILPDKKTGVMFVGTFEPNDFNQFQVDTAAIISEFQKAGVTQILIDLTDNGGGFVCLGQFLHQFLAGSQIGDPGFQSTSRANPLAQKIVAAHVAMGENDIGTFYSPDNWAFLNTTIQPVTFNYNNPSVPFVVNGRVDPTSQRFLDTCTESFVVPVPKTPPFPLNKIAIVSNGNCASTCAMFSTLMFERHHTKIAIFGGKPGEQVQYKGMAGNQVLEWSDLDTEIKSVGLDSDPLAPPDLLVNSNFRHNWRTAWSFFNEQIPIGIYDLFFLMMMFLPFLILAYVSEFPQLRFPYTKDTYNNPQNLWIFA